MLKFTKMHGIGNDFIIVNCLQQQFVPTKAVIQHLSQRRTGIGCDQVLLIEPSTNMYVDFNYRVFNADGGEVEHCGNGARCVIKYLFDHKFSNKSEIKLQTKLKTITGMKLSNGMIQVNMGFPLFHPKQIPFLSEENENNSYHIIVGGQLIKFGIVSIGNPHAVIKVIDNELQNSDKLEEIAKAIQNSMLFPNGVNVNFYVIKSRNEVKMRTYERGCGFTQACGTGACAVVAYNILQNEMDKSKPISVLMLGGVLHIVWDKSKDILMSGDAIFVFDGEIKL